MFVPTRCCFGEGINPKAIVIRCLEVHPSWVDRVEAIALKRIEYQLVRYRTKSIYNIQLNSSYAGFIGFCSLQFFQNQIHISQHTGTLARQPFSIARLIILFFWMICSSKRLKIKLKRNFPLTFNKAVGQKSSMAEGLGGFFFGMYTSEAILH